MRKNKVGSSQPDFKKEAVLFGGFFDPPHLGHLRAALACHITLPEAQIVFLPSYQSSEKTGSVLSLELREKFLELSLEELRKWENIDAFWWDYELRQRKITYTIDSLEKAHALGGERERLFFLLGSEQYKKLSTWKGASRIRNFCRLVVAPRTRMPERQDPMDIFLDMEPLDLSSSQIRHDLERSSLPKEVLAPAVEKELERLLERGENLYHNGL